MRTISDLKGLLVAAQILQQTRRAEARFKAGAERYAHNQLRIQQRPEIRALALAYAHQQGRPYLTVERSRRGISDELLAIRMHQALTGQPWSQVPFAERDKTLATYLPWLQAPASTVLSAAASSAALVAERSPAHAP